MTSPIFQATDGVALNPWGIDMNGLILGPGTPYGMIGLEGFDPPPVRVDDIDKQAEDGSFIYAQFLSKRVCTLTGDAVGQADSAQNAAMLALRFSFGAPVTDDVPLRINWPGWGYIVVFVKKSRISIPVDPQYAIGNAQWVAEVQGGDPRIFDDALSASSTTAPVYNGLDFGGGGGGLDFGGGGGGLDFGGGVNGLISVNNAGSYKTPWLARITGPCSDPQIEDVATGNKILVHTVLNAGDYLEIDSLARTIVQNGSSSRYGSMDPVSQWWMIQPGQSSMRFDVGAGGTGATSATVFYRSAWL